MRKNGTCLADDDSAMSLCNGCRTEVQGMAVMGLRVVVSQIGDVAAYYRSLQYAAQASSSDYCYPNEARSPWRSFKFEFWLASLPCLHLTSIPVGCRKQNVLL